MGGGAAKRKGIVLSSWDEKLSMQQNPCPQEQTAKKCHILDRKSRRIRSGTVRRLYQAEKEHKYTRVKLDAWPDRGKTKIDKHIYSYLEDELETEWFVIEDEVEKYIKGFQLVFTGIAMLQISSKEKLDKQTKKKGNEHPNAGLQRDRLRSRTILRRRWVPQKNTWRKYHLKSFLPGKPLEVLKEISLSCKNLTLRGYPNRP